MGASMAGTSGDAVTISGAGLVAHVEEIPGQGFRLAFLGPAGASHVPGPVTRPLPASPDRPMNAGLMCVRGAGYSGAGILDAFVCETGRALSPEPAGIRQLGDNSLEMTSQDRVSGFCFRTRFELADQGLKVSGCLENRTGSAVTVNRAASLLLPLPDWADYARLVHGSWAREGFSETLPLAAGAVERISRLGRTGFAGLPQLTLLDEQARSHASSGRTICIQLAWSGSHRLRAERLVDGSGELLAEALFETGEIVLQPGEVFTLPQAFVLMSDHGIDGLRAASWGAVRAVVPPLPPRPVHFNTWEACYFDFDENRLMTLATQAAALGAERFVLDDGWFRGRRDDTRALGDWEADPQRFPSGLAPLVAHVRGLGMGFGLWIEPEMVSPDSELFRAHPDWVLGWPEENLPTGRNQLVLNLAEPAVRDHLFRRISDLVRCSGIDYLKWDCNRELYPAMHQGRFVAHRHVEGVYELISDLCAAFPGLEIESCASGGARIDLGILRYTHRVWPSDATDALDRVRIQSVLSDYLPLEIIGAHVGPSVNHLTGRHLSMSFRVLVAMFGHLGMEVDPSTLTDDEQVCLRQGIGLYRKLRADIHSAALQRLFSPDPGLEATILHIAGGHALLRVLRLDMSRWARPARIAVQGLDPGASYEVTEFSQDFAHEISAGCYTGAALSWSGLDADPRLPASGRLFVLRRKGPVTQ